MHSYTWTILAGLLALGSSAAGLGIQRQSNGYQEQDTARAFYSYGYRDDNAARAEYSSLDGTSRGFYSYVDANGKLQTVRYEANGAQGFKAEASNQPQAPVDDGKAPLPVTDTEEVQQARLAHLNALRDAREEALAASLREEADRRQQDQSRNNNQDQQSGEQNLTDEDAAILERVRAELAAMLAERQRLGDLSRNRDDQEERQEQRQELRKEQRQELRQEQRQDQRQSLRQDQRQEQRQDLRQDERQNLRQEQREDRRQDQREDRRQDLREDRRQDQLEDRRQEQREDRRQEQREDRQREDLRQNSRQNERQSQRLDQSRNQEARDDLTLNREDARQNDRQLSQASLTSDRTEDDLRLRTIYSLADLSSSSYLKLGDLTSAEKLLEDRLDNSDLRVPISAYYTLLSPNTKYSVTTPTELRTLRPVALSRSLLVNKRN
ncbi:uncharacterized protein Dana_GF24387 [Drosophila ananassae]|uniref:Uncharacterized protein n=1 Tax=Drosophila ananassae TaxID=7217 RepID=B3M5S6_DROAN|nr:trichohyalin [Drosophila ananassae]EDV39616.1 uncharacterized protein Dana_GF24387 [Drosophila ananassae]